MTTANETIGKLLQGEQERDAIHIAVAPVRAAHQVSPGQRVGTDGHGLVSASEPHVGIVDPFLTKPVKAGEQCWLMLFPNTITTLRHEWVHPAFDKGMSESEQYLRAFADRLFSYYGKPDYEREWGTPFELLISCAETGFPTDINYEADCQPTPEFWHHYERYTGRKVSDKPEYFRCAC
jgi:hypothetical protein